jgi:uracil-DNA glycosylase family 4
VAWREQVAAEKRAAFAADEYWGRPVPGFGDPNATVVVVGLAPAAHGANRTGRMFTGDRSGEWLYRALYEAGFASRPRSLHRADDLVLSNAWVTAPVRCAPPANRPTPAERDNCAGWFDEELRLLSRAQVYVCLGQYAYQALWRSLASGGLELPRPRPRFGHGVELVVPGRRYLLLSYHPSQQNTFTGKLTGEMFQSVFDRAQTLSATGSPDP